MACACQKGKEDRVWDYVARDGSIKTYPSEIQARAAVIRAGGGRVVARQK
jgi:hypothetical protein